MNFLLEDIEKNLEEYKKIVETKDEKLAEARKILQGAKNSYETLTNETKQLKEYVVKIKQQYKQQQQQQQHSLQEQEYFSPKRYKKVVYEEATDSELEIEEEDTSTEEIVEQEKERKQQQTQPQNKIKIKIFDYLNKDAKRNRG